MLQLLSAPLVRNLFLQPCRRPLGKSLWSLSDTRNVHSHAAERRGVLTLGDPVIVSQTDDVRHIVRVLPPAVHLPPQNHPVHARVFACLSCFSFFDNVVKILRIPKYELPARSWQGLNTALLAGLGTGRFVRRHSRITQHVSVERQNPGKHDIQKKKRSAERCASRAEENLENTQTQASKRCRHTHSLRHKGV